MIAARHIGRTQALVTAPSPLAAFTILELLAVISIIIVLAGLILATSGYVRTKANRSRAAAEIAAIAAALENYKADNGIYPTDSANGTTHTLDARTMFDPTTAQYASASLFMYKELSGDTMGNRVPTGKSYFSFKPNMLLPKDQTLPVTAVADPFGCIRNAGRTWVCSSYGYSTAYQADPSKGYNPTYDLWTTATGTNSNDVTKWIKNW